MPAPPAFLLRHGMGAYAAQFYMGGALTAVERDTVLNALDPARTSFLSLSAWVAGHDVALELGENAARFESLYDEAKTLNDQVFDIEATLRSTDSADWNISADQISKIQQLSNATNSLWAMIQQGTPGATQPGLQPSPENPDLFFMPPNEPVEPPPGTSWGLTDLLRLLPAAGAIASPFLRFTPRGAPSPGAVVPVVTTPMPWWGWALIGVGGLGAVGIGFTILRRLL